MGTSDRRGLRPTLVVAVTVAVVAAALALVASPGGAGTEEVAVVGTSRLRAAAPATPAQGGRSGDLAQAVFPDPTGDERYDDPVAATEAFARDLVGFTNVITGDLRQGDVRSGEVELRSVEDGPVTTVFVRQLGPDSSWFVIGSTTVNIELQRPEPLERVSNPLTIEARARAFEATWLAEVRADGTDGPVGEQVITGGGGGEQLEPLSAEVPFDAGGAGGGSLLLLTRSARDGSVQEVASVPVAFRDPITFTG